MGDYFSFCMEIRLWPLPEALLTTVGGVISTPHLQPTGDCAGGYSVLRQGPAEDPRMAVQLPMGKDTWQCDSNEGPRHEQSTPQAATAEALHTVGWQHTDRNRQLGM